MDRISSGGGLQGGEVAQSSSITHQSFCGEVPCLVWVTTAQSLALKTMSSGCDCFVTMVLVL